MSIGSLIFLPLLLAPATHSALPSQPTYGLPACTGQVTGLTERYERDTIYIDQCAVGTVVAENLEIVDLTSSVVVVMVNGEAVVVQLPE